MSNNPLQTNNITKCFAKTCRSTLCQTPPVKGKKRCRMHYGAKGIGTPKGSQNAFKHGRYSRETIANRKETVMLIRQFRALLREISLI
ncbi:hypothetical protein Megvenef_00588 [Candidatus Megaera venefica]|uniref:Uncharacterized protein n=1 Tax=Candidatus Megaera venefica TaxID=2055910 RepID=A0ABU5NBS4_9RICK|nr:HGGxSTG domain-containing protein [Candidatus Megaera venefica]MEA0970621.1 hypothetical protein [Candidatus Megaera venefica]